MTLVGSVIKGGLFTTNGLMSRHVHEDGATLCIQYTEEIVLESISIIYVSNIVGGAVDQNNYDNGPFTYR